MVSIWRNNSVISNPMEVDFKIIRPCVIRNVKKKWLIFFCGLISFSTLIGQVVSPVCHYNFDNDDLTESNGNFLPGEARSNIDYICGVGENSRALLFDGSVDTVTIDPAVKDLFDRDFAFSMAFWIDPVQGAYTLFSIQDSCDVDSSFIITYSGIFNELSLEFSRDISEAVIFSATLDELSCWHELIFIRDKELSLIHI